MPNWCQTEIRVYSSADDVRSLYNHMKEAFNQGIDTDFGKEWLGNLATYIGIPYETVPCRGWVDYMYIDGDFDNPEPIDFHLQLSTMTAWGPMVEIIKMFADKYCKENKVYYVASEEGNALYMTNDPDYKGHYVIDICDTGDKYSEFFYDIDDRDDVSPGRLNLLLREAFGITGNASTTDLIKRLKKETKNIRIFQYEFEEVVL